jgi:PKD repeat protein
MKKIFCLTLILNLFFLFNISSQPSNGGLPYSFKNKTLISDIHNVELQKPDIGFINLQDDSDGKDGIVRKIGRSVPADLSMNSCGTWTKLPDGGRLWRLSVRIKDAKALIIGFDKFFLSPGSTLYVYNENHKQILGAYTSEINPKNNDYLGIEAIQGEMFTLEYFEPENSIGKSYLNIKSVGYIYRDVNFLSKYCDVKSAEFGASGSCEVNVNCSEGTNWQNQKKGVARILLLDQGSWGWCTGSLINNKRLDCTRYFLTADHCGKTATTSELNQWIFYFNYEGAGCPDPTTEPTPNSLTGCTLKAHGGNGGASGSDFFLVQLTQNPTFNPYFNGWDKSGTASSSGVSIHHPAGDIKKISTYTSTLTSTTYGGSVANTHWQVVWAGTANGHGVTEGGSSGSPIFNSAGLIIGDLTGGSSYCNHLTSPDLYGKFSYSWASNGTTAATRLKDWLDPDNTGVSSLTGMYCSGTLTADFSGTPTSLNVGGTVNFSDLSTGTPTTWSWSITPNTGLTYTGGTSASSQNPKVIFNTAGTYTVALTIGNGSTTNTKTRTSYITVSQGGSATCDTTSNILDTESITYYGFSTKWGYWTGHSQNLWSKFADKFTSNTHTVIYGAYLAVAKAKFANTSSNIKLKLYNGSGSTPGTELASKTVNINTLTAGNWNQILFTNPITVTGNFFLGYEINYSPAGDTFVAYNAAIRGAGGTNTAYVYDGTSWVPYTTKNSTFATSLGIFVIRCSTTTDIEENISEENIVLYPNPANNNISIGFHDIVPEKAFIRIFDYTGKQVMEFDESLQNSSLISFDISSLHNGIYFINITTKNLRITRKFTVIR